MKNSKETLKKRNALKRKWKEIIDINSFPHTIVKKCKDCGDDKECQWQHSFTQTGNPEYRARCIECHKKYLSELRKKTRKRLNFKKKKRSKENKIKCIKYLGNKCQICGYNKSIYGLTFHHRNPEEKERNISEMIQNLSFENKKLKEELNKCDLLCFNCHMELHGESDV